jgi:endonuclease-3 related protein
MNPLVIYNRLYKYYGPQHWWPVSSARGDKRFEICVGAILTQNTNWQNVEKALANLHKAKMLTPGAMAKCPIAKLERLIKPSGYFRQKAKKLKIFSKYICENYQADTKKFLQGNLLKKRGELLTIWGIGPETVDSILLYAGGKPVFVIDAYTKRLCAECGIKYKEYDDYRQYFEKHVPKSVKKYNEFHALIVKWGKEHGKNKKLAISIIKKPLLLQR